MSEIASLKVELPAETIGFRELTAGVRNCFVGVVIALISLAWFVVTHTPTSITVVPIPAIQSITSIEIVSRSIVIEHSGVIVRNEMVQGSGVIVDSSGLIVTAAHLMELVDLFELTTTVILADGTQYEASSEMYIDWDLDIAIIRIDPNEPLTSVELVPSDNYAVGTPIVTIGMPHRYPQWHSYGHIARPRNGHILSLDLDINPGNSGGPIFVGDKCIGIIVSRILFTDMSFGVASEVCITALELYRILYE